MPVLAGNAAFATLLTRLRHANAAKPVASSIADAGSGVPPVSVCSACSIKVSTAKSWRLPPNPTDVRVKLIPVISALESSTPINSGSPARLLSSVSDVELAVICAVNWPAVSACSQRPAPNTAGKVTPRGPLLNVQIRVSPAVNPLATGPQLHGTATQSTDSWLPNAFSEPLTELTPVNAPVGVARKLMPRTVPSAPNCDQLTVVSTANAPGEVTRTGPPCSTPTASKATNRTCNLNLDIVKNLPPRTSR